MALALMSPSFADGDEIPTRYTCEGEDVSPPLFWTGVPEGTETLALVVDDPDAPDPRAPQRRWVHWVLYNIPASAEELPEDVSPRDLPPGTLEGLNDWIRTGYGGPCPPVGRHRYFFKLYALDSWLPDLDEPRAGDLEPELKRFLIERAELVGTYEKKGKKRTTRRR